MSDTTGPRVSKGGLNQRTDTPRPPSPPGQGGPGFPPKQDVVKEDSRQDWFIRASQQVERGKRILKICKRLEDEDGLPDSVMCGLKSFAEGLLSAAQAVIGHEDD